MRTAQRDAADLVHEQLQEQSEERKQHDDRPQCGKLLASDLDDVGRVQKHAASENSDRETQRRTTHCNEPQNGHGRIGQR